MGDLYDAVAATPDGERLLAAAESRYRVLELLHAAREAAGLSKAELAKQLGVRKSAVGDVLNGSGNVQINTLSDYLHEMGRCLVLSSVPVAESPAAKSWKVTRVSLTVGSPAGVVTGAADVAHPDGTVLDVNAGEAVVRESWTGISLGWQQMTADAARAESGNAAAVA